MSDLLSFTIPPPVDFQQEEGYSFLLLIVNSKAQREPRIDEGSFSSWLGNGGKKLERFKVRLSREP